MKSRPVGPTILPIIKAYNPDWLPKLMTESPGLTKWPIRFMYPGYHVPVNAIWLDTEESLESTNMLNP